MTDTLPRSADIRIPARDNFDLAATVVRPPRSNGGVVVISSATAVSRNFYRHFAAYLATHGFTVLCYDYRGIGGSRPDSLRNFDANMRDWIFSDMAGALDWASNELSPERLFIVGHSIGGQAAGLLDNTHNVDGMLTISAQSGYWRLQGAEQKFTVWFHVTVTFPLLATLFGYVPWSRFGATEDLPKGVAMEWSRWCRNPGYILGDKNLPLGRYQAFDSPVLAYSFGDDKWGTPKSVDVMMAAYPWLERRHVEPSDIGLASIGHFGYFRSQSSRLWADAVDWFRQQSD